MASSSQLTINQHQGQNQRYKEPLPDGCRPLEMMLIPAGSFLMGSPEGELEREPREGPQHQVTLSQFFMARYPVTQAQWRAVAAMPQVKRELKPDPSNFKGDDRPVEKVSWYDAVEFCDRLTLHTDRQYRLPTEAEWEYACRAGTTTPFHFGETITTELANYCGEDRTIGRQEYSGSYGAGPKGEYREETTPVDAFEFANAYGLHDMHGNVLEWCADHYGSYEQTPIDGSAFVTDDEEARRILRGGSWLDDPRYCRSAYRTDGTPSPADNYIGFRLSCSAPRT
ncbi:MAG: formylglycine-generating enzyme family protein [Cyanobacteria bacterium J06555_13]